MRKGSVLIPLIVICCFVIGCGNPEDSMHVMKGTQEDIILGGKQQVKAPPVEIKTVQEKTREEKEKEIAAAEINLARANPFLTKEEEEAFKETQGRIIVENMNLSAVMYAPPNSKVIIDGAILKEGDSIGSKKIIEIQPKAVILKDEKSKREYMLKPKGAAGKP